MAVHATDIITFKRRCMSIQIMTYRERDILIRRFASLKMRCTIYLLKLFASLVVISPLLLLTGALRHDEKGVEWRISILGDLVYLSGYSKNRVLLKRIICPAKAGQLASEELPQLSKSPTPPPCIPKISWKW